MGAERSLAPTLNRRKCLSLLESNIHQNQMAMYTYQKWRDLTPPKVYPKRQPELEPPKRKKKKKNKRKRKALAGMQNATGIGALDRFNQMSAKGNPNNALIKALVDVLAAAVIGPAVSATLGKFGPLAGAALSFGGHYMGDESGLMRGAGMSTIGHSIAKTKEYREEGSSVQTRLKGLKSDLLRLVFLQKDEAPVSGMPESSVEIEPMEEPGDGISATPPMMEPDAGDDHTNETFGKVAPDIFQEARHISDDLMQEFLDEDEGSDQGQVSGHAFGEYQPGEESDDPEGDADEEPDDPFGNEPDFSQY